MFLSKRFLTISRINSYRFFSENAKQPFRVLVDLDCPICDKEVCYLKRTEKKKFGDNRVDFVNINHPSFKAEDHNGITFQEAMDNLHVITSDNKILMKMPAQRALWRECGWTALAAFTDLPIIRNLADVGYDF